VLTHGRGQQSEWTQRKKKRLCEIDICELFITPAIKDAGWDPLRQIRREVTLTPEPEVVRGNVSSRKREEVIGLIKFSKSEKVIGGTYGGIDCI